MEKAIILCFPATVTQPGMSWKSMELTINMVIKMGSCLLWVLYLWSSVELVLSNFRIGIIDDCKINCRLFVDNFFIFLLNEKFGQILDMHVHVLFIK